MEPIHEADVQTQPGKRLAEEPKQKKSCGRTVKIVAGAVAAAVVVLFCACCGKAESLRKKGAVFLAKSKRIRYTICVELCVKGGLSA